ncbi:class I SAM-dependent methyltransferase [Actinomycetospora chiangmaiensis]|uniref:class I SAM-dependent methyltransferase n=1 Tax=Actinomycetospora chiangmaiensis TaxID=402650 RepID=UPI000374761A|nr:methyltransferase domain-containing protein [Actinomycetospora chiangmaiensis]
MDRSRDEHNAKVLEQFRLQAPTFTDTGVFASNLDWIVDRLAPRPGEQALDVASGAGHLGRALAPRLGHVSALDLTPEMLAHGDRIARDAGLRNITFAVGDATALPWLDDQFDLVVCRLTLHQVADPAAVVREMVRVARPDGRIGITDLVLEPDEADPDLVDRNTHLERLRDPSHGRTLSTTEIHGLLTDAGATPISTELRDNPLDVEDWMERSHTPEADRDEIRRQLDAELAGGPATGLRPGRDGDVRTMTHVWATVLAEPRPA